MLRYNLKSLLRVVTAISVYCAVVQTAGYWVTAALAFLAGALWWATRSRRRGWMLAVRGATALACVVVSWFLVADLSYFQWHCPNCNSYRNYSQRRLLGIPVVVDTHSDESTISVALSDLGVPCHHAEAKYRHLGRLWGMIIRTTYDRGVQSYVGRDHRYDSEMQECMYRRGCADREFAVEAHRQLLIDKNYAFLEAVIIADGIVEKNIANKSCREALVWLKHPHIVFPECYGCGEVTKSPEHLIPIVEEVYQLGAEKVLAIEVAESTAILIDNKIFRQSDYTYDLVMAERERYRFAEDIEVSEARYLAIELPAEACTRQRLFDWQAALRLVSNTMPTKDYGQSYLLLSFEELLR